MKELNVSFLNELFKLCFRKKEVIEACCQYLEYHYIPIESYKKVWKALHDYYKTNDRLPTIGLISQSFSVRSKNNEEALKVLSQIKETTITNMDDILEKLEEYIKKSMFVEMYDKLADLYDNEEQEKAYLLVREKSEELVHFSIRSNIFYYERVFSDFEKRYSLRKLRKEMGEDGILKVPFSIDELDDVTFGGPDKTDTFLFLAQSGVGKTKLLRWIGMNAARKGFNVLHFQGEGSKQECLNGYDAMWTGQSIYDIEFGNINPLLYERLKKILSEMAQDKGEVYVQAYEQFETASLRDARKVIVDFEKVYGLLPDLILFDYFELFDPGDGKTYQVSEERQRREALSQKMKNLAIEFNTRIGTATSASTVHPEKLDDPGFVMTRYDISEFKGALKPFSYFITMNQTRDEYDAGIMRLYCDKLRKSKANQTIKIYQNYKHDRFYDRKRTLNEFYKV